MDRVLLGPKPSPVMVEADRARERFGWASRDVCSLCPETEHKDPRGRVTKFKSTTWVCGVCRKCAACHSPGQCMATTWDLGPGR